MIYVLSPVTYVFHAMIYVFISVMPLMALSQGGRWDTPARGQVPRLIAINSPSMQLHFHLHAPVK